MALTWNITKVLWLLTGRATSDLRGWTVIPVAYVTRKLCSNINDAIPTSVKCNLEDEVRSHSK